MNKFYAIFFLSLYFLTAQAQSTQNIKGTVTDAESNFPLPGASVTVWKDSVMLGGVAADENGNYKVMQVPVGRVDVRISMVGYNPYFVSNVQLISGKELVINASLNERSFETKEVVITAAKNYETRNEMSTVSARTFSVEETERYAGSRSDPARMASNFAGVQGADDSRNDIVIRGNSPAGLSYHLEGVEIFNPNHFSIPGTQGGPVSMLNSKYLTNSDFFTGAFPAEYGNALAGVFDLKMRNGNNDRHEMSAQFGVLGTELFAEGPLSNNTDAPNASYLFNARYSTLALFSLLGLKIGTDAVPTYYDGAFRFHVPLKKNASLAFFGIGGKSKIDILISDQLKPVLQLYGENDRDQHFGTSNVLAGLTYGKSFSEKTFFKVPLVFNREAQKSFHQLVFRHVDAAADSTFVLDSLVDLMRYDFTVSKISVAPFVNTKLRSNLVLKAGVEIDAYYYHFNDSIRQSLQPADSNYGRFQTRWNSRGSTLLIQPYAQLKWTLSDKWIFNFGIHQTTFLLSKSFSLEPRVGVKWQPNESNQFSLGCGLHSQIQPIYIYYYNGATPNVEGDLYNKSIQPSSTFHAVAGYQHAFSPNLYLKTEVYYQHLRRVPVDTGATSFSLINAGSGFTRIFPGKLTNAGTADNYGWELTLEKNFSRKYFFMLTTSLFQATYAGSDGVKRSSDFNGRYILNALFTKEFSLGKKSVLSIGTKVTTEGGHWYGPVDTALSQIRREVVYVDSSRNSLQFKPYFRWDIKLNYTINSKSVSHEIGLDLINVLGTKNILSLSYTSEAPYVIRNYQLGFLPLFYYRINFGIGRRQQ